MEIKEKEFKELNPLENLLFNPGFALRYRSSPEFLPNQ